MIIENGVLISISKQDVVDGVLTIPSSVKKIDLDVAYDAYYDSNEDSELKKRFIVRDEFMNETIVNPIKKLVIEEGVEEISRHSFFGFKILEANLPSTLTKVAEGAFQSCNIEVLNFAKNSKLTKIGAGAFLYCNLKQLNVPKNIEVIEESAFRENNDLEKIVFEEGSKLTVVDKKSFYNCNIKNINFPKSLKVFNDALDFKEMKEGIVSFNEGLENFTSYSRMDGTLKELVLPSTVTKAVIEFSYPQKPESAEDLVILHVKDKTQGKITLSVFDKRIININSTSPGYKYIEFARVSDYLKSTPLSDHNISSEVIVVSENGIFDLNSKKMDKNFKEHAKRALDARRIDNYVAFCDALKKAYGGKLMHYPPIEDAFAVPLDRVNDYAKNRKLFKELHDSANNKNFSRIRREAFVKFAIHIGLLEQDAGVKNGAITLLRKHLLSVNDFNDNQEYVQLIQFKNQPAKYSAKKFNLVKAIFNSENENYYQSAWSNAFKACMHFEELSDLRRDIKPEDVNRYFMEKVYEDVNDQNKDLAQLASMFNLRSTSFSKLSDWYVQAKKEKVKNIFDTLSELSEDVKKKQVATSDKLLDEAGHKFKFEWLNKDSEKSAMLGYIANCCAKIGDLGEKLLQSTLLNKQVQNLVVKDENNTILGKSTAYFNVDEGILHFNNIETNANFLKKIEKNDNTRNLFLEAFLRGMYGMIEEYNKTVNGTNIKKIKIATIGDDFTDFESELSQRFVRAASKYYTTPDFFGYEPRDDQRFLIYKDGVLGKSYYKQKDKYKGSTLFQNEYLEELAMQDLSDENKAEYEDLSDAELDYEDIELEK